MLRQTPKRDQCDLGLCVRNSQNHVGLQLAFQRRVISWSRAVEFIATFYVFCRKCEVQFRNELKQL